MQSGIYFRQTLIHFLVVIITLYSCHRSADDPLIFKLERSDYTERIVAIGTIQAVNTISVVAPRVNASSMTVTFLAKDGAFVKKGDTICILSASDLESIYESFKINDETMQADLKKLEATNTLDMSVLEAKVETNDALLEITMLDSVQKKFAPPAKQQLISLELEKAQIEKNKLAKQLIAQKKIDVSELASLRSRIMINNNRLQIYSDQIKSLKVLAPIDGLVMHVESPTMKFMSSSGMGELGGKIEEGSSVWSSMGLLQIPDLKEMQVMVEVPEVDYKRIEKDQKVNIIIEASKNLFTTGIIKRKALIGKKGQQESALKTYEVIVSIDSCHSKMLPGLSARCEIIVTEIKDTLVVPTISIFEKDSLKVMYSYVGKVFIPVEIETGLSNSSETIVTKGLSGNEVLALMEPPRKMIIKSKKNLVEKDLSKNYVTDTTKLIPVR